MTRTSDWREGHRLLCERVAAIPGALTEAFAKDPEPLHFDPRTVRRFLTTGIGSSSAHARYLAYLLFAHVGVAARFVPSGDWVSGSVAPSRDDVLLVFSQGLSPNAHFALREPPAWKGLVLFTAASDASEREPVRASLAALREAGGAIHSFPGEDEYGTLLRVLGPICAYAAALRFATQIGRSLGADTRCFEVEVPLLCERIAAAEATLDRAVDAVAERGGEFPRAAPFAFLAQGSYAELIDNLRFKILEGLLRPLPPAWDLLHFAHGPYQQAFDGKAILIGLTCADAPQEAALLERIDGMCAGRHALLRFPAALPAPLAIFEHEALVNAWVLRGIASEQIDQIRWPGRGADAALYDFEPDTAAALDPPARAAPSTGAGAPRPALAQLTWPELEEQIQGGRTTAVLPLGATEQHGPHLPFATDTWIADELARRFCEVFPEAVQLPALAFGCSSEHMGFPGTLDLRPETLRALLCDVLASLRAHGFERAFLFSAHGGNAAILRDALPELAKASEPLRVIAYTDLVELTATLRRVSAELGVAPEAAGHHAGELETSILSSLRPQSVRHSELGPGTLFKTGDAQALFYPSLRANAPNGTVGDPRGAAATRAERYLETWVGLLATTYRRANHDA